MCLDRRHVLGLSATILTVAAALHLLRLAMGWRVVIANFEVPLWFSGIGVVVAGYLAYELWKLAAEKKTKR